MIKNSALGEMILDMVSTLLSASIELYEIVVHNPKEAPQLIKLMNESLNAIDVNLDQLKDEEPAIMAHLITKNILYSLNENNSKLIKKPTLFAHKIEFELIPLIQELYVDLYFWGFCYPDRNRMNSYYENEMLKLCPFPYVEKYKSEGLFKYDLSIVVFAYNKIEYTKLCVPYLLDHLPENLKYELILVNNGCNDGTKEYFESINPHKQVDILHNTKSYSFVSRIIEGKNILFVSNDIVYTPGALANMLTCLESDEKIGCVVPSCPNIANLQTIDAEYSNLDELIQFAKLNNISNPRRWEQRSRLHTPTVLARSDSPAIYALFGYLYPNSPDRILSFTDDTMSLILRRSGYKCILAKDAFVHHFGSVTVREQIKETNHFYLNGRREFHQLFGVDPWGVGFCYNLELMETLNFVVSNPVNILGINSGLGDTPMQIKSNVLQKSNVTAQIYNTTNQENYFQDLLGMSDFFKPVKHLSQVSQLFEGVYFRYIILETFDDSESDLLNSIHKIYKKIESSGVLAIRKIGKNSLSKLGKLYPNNTQTNNWILIYKN